MAIPTPPSPLPVDTVQRVIVLPAEPTVLGAVVGAISRLANAETWEQSEGGITPDEVASVMLAALKAFIESLS